MMKAMKILVLNAGSSSLKFKLYEAGGLAALAWGMVEQIGEEEARSHITVSGGREDVLRSRVGGHEEALEVVFGLMRRHGALDDVRELAGIGHRVVHGGERFQAPVLVTSDVMAAIEELFSLSPLHNPANLSGIRVALAKAAGVPQVAVFDTAYHQSIPPHAYRYALPHDLYERHMVRRYGFHGTSHHFVARQAARFLGLAADEIKAVSLHLGNGASATAIDRGRSVDTSMGLTPLEGLVMGTRSGDLDPAVIFYLARQTGMGLDEIDRLLNRRSGLKGLCDHNDMREIINLAAKGDGRASLALEIFCYRLKKYIGAYLAVLNGAHCLIFTGGIGENAAEVRHKACSGLDALGVVLDAAANRKKFSGAADISAPASRVRILVVPTDEELEIARHTARVISDAVT